MIDSGHALADGTLHQTGQGGEDVDWGVDASLVHVSIDVYLTLGDIAGEIWDWMSDIVVGHCKNRNLGDGTNLVGDSTSSLVDGGKIGIHVTWISSSSWYFFSGGRNLSQSVGVGGHIGQNGKHMHFLLVGKMLGGGQGKSWGDDTLDGGVVGVVHEKNNSIHGSINLEISLEESSSLKIDTHSSKNNTEVLIRVIKDIFALNKRSLPTDLRTNLIMRKTSGREERNLLTSGDTSHGING